MSRKSETKQFAMKNYDLAKDKGEEPSINSDTNEQVMERIYMLQRSEIGFGDLNIDAKLGGTECEGKGYDVLKDGSLLSVVQVDGVECCNKEKGDINEDSQITNITPIKPLKGLSREDYPKDWSNKRIKKKMQAIRNFLAVVDRIRNILQNFPLATSSHMASCEHNSSKRKHNDDLSETSTTEGSQISRKRSRSEGDADSSCTHTTVDIIPVSSAVLSGQSPYFFTLFKNSDEEEVNIRIQQSERQSMRELLKFMYILKLPWTTSDEVLAILILADKYNVPRCVKYCTNMLCNQPMTVEHALEYLELPSRLTMRADLEQLTKEATQFLQTHYRDTINLEKDIMELSLLGLEAVLTSDRLSLDYEDSIFDLVLKWAERHYVELKERRNILQTRLIRHIRFPFMSEQKLKCVWKCKLLDPMVSHKVVLEALLFKGGVGHLKSFSTLTQEQLTERFYKYKPVKVVECNLPRKEATIFLELRMNECENLYPAGRLHSQVFSFDGFSFTIRVQCYQDPESMAITFGLGVAMIASKPTHLLVDVKFSTRRKPSFDYEYSHSFEHLFTENSGVVGTNDLLKTTWDSFIGSNSVYFFDKNLYIKVELKVINLV